MRAGLLFLLLVFAAGCARKVTGPGGPADAYQEDLAGLRRGPIEVADTVKPGDSVKQQTERDPKRYVEARHAINKKLDNVLDSIRVQNLAEGTVDGFTIQLYSGSSLEEAMNVTKQFGITMPEMQAELEYVQPNYKVRTGKFYTRLDAQPHYLAIRRHFPNAIVLPARIPIND